MRYRTRVELAFRRLERRVHVGKERGLYQVSALIRKEAREKMKYRKGASPPGKPPSAHTRSGLKEINYHVRGSQSIIGPRKFPRSNFFNRPVPNIHEKGGIAVGNSFRIKRTSLYPERSFMWSAVKRLHEKKKIPRQFAISMRAGL